MTTSSGKDEVQRCEAPSTELLGTNKNFLQMLFVVAYSSKPLIGHLDIVQNLSKLSKISDSGMAKKITEFRF